MEALPPAIEETDSLRILLAEYPSLLAAYENGLLTASQVANVLANETDFVAEALDRQKEAADEAAKALDALFKRQQAIAEHGSALQAAIAGNLGPPGTTSGGRGISGRVDSGALALAIGNAGEAGRRLEEGTGRIGPGGSLIVVEGDVVIEDASTAVERVADRVREANDRGLLDPATGGNDF